jgi:hypothetical protein
MALIWNNGNPTSPRIQGEVRVIDGQLHLEGDLAHLESHLRLCFTVSEERGCSLWSVLRAEYRGYPYGVQIVAYTPSRSTSGRMRKQEKAAANHADVPVQQRLF